MITVISYPWDILVKLLATVKIKEIVFFSDKYNGTVEKSIAKKTFKMSNIKGREGYPFLKRRDLYFLMYTGVGLIHAVLLAWPISRGGYFQKTLPKFTTIFKFRNYSRKFDPLRSWSEH